MNSMTKVKTHTQQSSLFSSPVNGNLTTTAYQLPDNLSEEQWLQAGRELGRVRGSTMWWIGDWWAYGEYRWGDRRSITESDDWDGPAFQTCMNAATVCRAIETSRRREVLSFGIHQDIAPLPHDWQDKVLDWAEGSDADRLRTVREVRDHIRGVKQFLSQGWTPDQLDRKNRAEAGECVVATIREVEGRQIDSALLAWAEANGHYVRIDRKTEWGNPFEMPEDGDRIEVIDLFTKHYWPFKVGLLKKAAGLKGKVLGCWCHPEPCHGHLIAECVNRAASEKRTVAQIADEISLQDG